MWRVRTAMRCAGLYLSAMASVVAMMDALAVGDEWT